MTHLVSSQDSHRCAESLPDELSCPRQLTAQIAGRALRQVALKGGEGS